jgi:nicotinamidase-related amidase
MALVIEKFGSSCGLLVIDAQEGVNVCSHWGGPDGRRNNPQAEESIAQLLAGWRTAALPIYFTLHDSREQASPLKLSLDSGKPIAGLEPKNGDRVVTKDVNSGFVGTQLELMLRRDRINRLVVAGFFTNMCVDTTVRMAGNLGYDTYLAHDACAASNRLRPDGGSFDADLVHNVSVANLHGEFCTALDTASLLGLLEADAPHLERVQGNE